MFKVVQRVDDMSESEKWKAEDEEDEHSEDENDENKDSSGQPMF